MAASLRSEWLFDPHVSFLNHGSYGACPRVVLEKQQELRTRIEQEPVRFFVREYQELLDSAREKVARFLGARPDDLAFVSNATTGCNTVLRSLELNPGDELVVTDHGYNACRTAIEFAAERAGASVVVASLPFPIEGPEVVEQAVLSVVGKRTRCVLIDHVTSPTGLVLPVERLVAALRERGVFVMIDGAHAPGMLPLDLTALGADAYTGNAHKWLCAPKGAAILHVRPEHHGRVRPLTISHGANAQGSDRSRFHLEFDWCGTFDPTAWLSIPAAMDFLKGLLPGGWEALRASNHAKVVAGRQALCAALGEPPPAPASMLGSLASVLLPELPATMLEKIRWNDPLADRLWHEHSIEVPIMDWPSPRRRLLRISAQAYNEVGEYEQLAALLPGMLADEAAHVTETQPS